MTIKSLNDTIKQMIKRPLQGIESIPFFQKVSDGVIIPLDPKIREENGIWIVKDYENAKIDLKYTRKSNLKDIFNSAINLNRKNSCALNYFPQFEENYLETNKMSILDKETIEKYNLYLKRCDDILTSLNDPNDFDLSHGGIDSFSIRGHIENLSKFNSTLGEFVGGPLEYNLSITRSGNYDSGWNKSITHGLRPRKNI